MLGTFVLSAGETAADTAYVQQQPLRPVYSVYSFEAGSSHVAETYLSPLRYDGWTMALGYSRAQSMRFDPQNWTMELGARLALDRMLNRPSHNSTEWRLKFELSWAMMHKWRLSDGITLYAGGSTRADAGVYYLPRNGNNPAAAKASWTIGPRIGAVWNLNIGRCPLMLMYTAEMPIAGIFFQPAYGELYYEIYLGNRSGLVRGAWPGNYRRLDQAITADIRFGATILRVGYSPRIFSSKASDIVTRNVSHTFIFGIASEWIALDHRKTADISIPVLSAY